jgi:hypothetical protein
MPTFPLYEERSDWWNFERLSQWDPTHPAAAWAATLLQEAAAIRVPCPECGMVASVRTNLNHLLRDHRAGYAEAATWLEDADADLFSLAVHYLATKARASRQPAAGAEVAESHRRAGGGSHPASFSNRERGLLPGWCRTRIVADQPGAC